MKLCRFTQGASTRIGKVEGDWVVDLSGVAGVTGSICALLADMPALKRALEEATGPVFALEAVKLEAPIVDPQKFLAIGMTLEPGDVIVTGTPSGVGIASRSVLQPGDVVRVEVDGLGFIENTFVA